MEKPDRGKEPIQKVCKKVSLPQRLGTLEPTGTILGGEGGSHLDDSVVVCSSLHLVFPSPLNLFLTEGSSDMSSYASLKIVGSAVTHVWDLYLNMCHSK